MDWKQTLTNRYEIIKTAVNPATGRLDAGVREVYPQKTVMITYNTINTAVRSGAKRCQNNAAVSDSAINPANTIVGINGAATHTATIPHAGIDAPILSANNR